MHEDGFLDKHLLPKKRILDVYFEELDVSDPKKPKLGTKRSKDYYENPEILNLKSTAYTGILYKINLKLVEPSEHTKLVKQYRIYKPEENAQKLGVIISQNIPEELLNPFHIFTISGKIEVQIENLSK